MSGLLNLLLLQTWFINGTLPNMSCDNEFNLIFFDVFKDFEYSVLNFLINSFKNNMISLNMFMLFSLTNSIIILFFEQFLYIEFFDSVTIPSWKCCL